MEFVYEIPVHTEKAVIPASGTRRESFWDALGKIPDKPE